MRSAPRLTSLLLGTALLVAGIAPGAAAQDASPLATPSPMCSVLSAQEISDAVGVPVTISSSSDDGCDYTGDAAKGDYFSVSSNRTGDSLEALKQAFTGEATTVGSQEALFVAGDYSPLIFVATPDGGSYSLMVVGSVGKDVDAKAVLTSLAELALPRLAAVPAALPDPTAQPLEGDADLEALMPAQVGGVEMTISSMSGNDLAAGGAVPAEFTAVLEGIGKTIQDVRVGIGYAMDATAGTSSTITAFQVKGADISALEESLLPILAQGSNVDGQTAQQIAGKDVTSANIGGTVTYLYPHDDILWVVTALEPALTEIFQKLP